MFVIIFFAACKCLAGGYDESFTGHHYGDREFLDRVFACEHRKIKSQCATSMNREGRHGSVDKNVEKTEYTPGDDKFFKVRSLISLGELYENLGRIVRKRTAFNLY